MLLDKLIKLYLEHGKSFNAPNPTNLTLSGVLGSWEVLTSLSLIFFLSFRLSLVAL